MTVLMNKAFSPLRINKTEIKNRFAVSAMVVNYCNPDGTATGRYLNYMKAKASGGWGLIITGDFGIDEHAKGFSRIPGLWNDGQIAGFKDVTAAVHDEGAKIFAQIYHAGRQTGSDMTGVVPVAPSAIKDPTMDEAPRELSAGEISILAEKFGDTALRAKKAGFDGVEIHGAHGYLIDQFFSPFSNKRTDEYGGSILNRCRFALEIIENVRLQVGEDFPVTIRLSVDEFVEGGIKVEDAKVIARIMENAGVDGIHASFGVYKSGHLNCPPAAVGHAYKVDLAAEIKKVVSIPVITVGRINDPLYVESIVLSGKADLVAMGRASLADPDIPKKAAEGRFEDIIHCIACRQGCVGRIGLPDGENDVRCVLNPLTGKENEFKITEAPVKKRVIIAGGGVAGLEAGIIAARRGHSVEIFEKDEALGGQWRQASVPPAKEELSAFTVWQKTQLQKLGVKINLGTELSPELVLSIKPDAVIVATGAKPVIPSIPGNDSDYVISVEDLLLGKKQAGGRIAVIGGGLIGCEVAAFLANHGKTPVVFEMLDDIASDGEPANRLFLLEDLENNDVKVFKQCRVISVENHEVEIEQDGKSDSIKDIDTVVFAVGSKPVNKLASEIKDYGADVVVVGDALLPGNALNATEQGFKAGLEI